MNNAFLCRNESKEPEKLDLSYLSEKMLIFAEEINSILEKETSIIKGKIQNSLIDIVIK